MNEEEKLIQVNEYFSMMLECLRQRNFSRATGYLYLIYNRLEFQPSTLSQVQFIGMSERDSLRIREDYVREFEDDPAGHMRLMSFHFRSDRLDVIRKIWLDTCANAVKGFHFQPSHQTGIYDAEQGKLHTAISSLGMGQDVTAVLGELRKPDAKQRAPVNKPVTSGGEQATKRHIQTEAGEPIGMNGVSLNGSLAGFDMPTRYYFRYGTKADALTESTEVRNMPAGRHGRVRDTGENLFHRISANAAALIFKKTENIVTGSDLPNRFPLVSMSLEWPFGKDRNHLNGIGIIDLLLGWTTQAHEYGTRPYWKSATTYPTQSYPGESMDLRDAVFSLTYRSDDLDAKDFSPVVWIHGRTGTAFFPETFDDLTAWAVTDDTAPKSFQADGAWHRLDFDLPGQSTAWSFCGSNTEEMGTGMERYTYAPIQQIQRENNGGNVCLAFVHGFDLNTPEGSVEIAELELTYRSRSLLGPGQQADLCAYSENITGDPGRLTDGSIGDVENCWFTGIAPDAPVELVWRLRDDADIESFRLHQCVLAPAKDVVLALSVDGQVYQDVWQGALEDTPEDPADWGDIRTGKGLVCVVVLPQSVRARYLRLRIKSAYRHGVAGLDAFEVFGRGLPFMPSPEKFSFSENVEGLPAGSPIFAQLVAENADGIFEGDVVEICRPDRDVPHILSAQVIERRENWARIALRTIAMGSIATLNIVLMAEDGEEISPSPLSIGKWTAARDVRVIVHGLKPGVSYQGLCRAENENGTSSDFTFACDANG